MSLFRLQKFDCFQGMKDKKMRAFLPKPLTEESKLPVGQACVLCVGPVVLRKGHKACSHQRKANAGSTTPHRSTCCIIKLPFTPLLGPMSILFFYLVPPSLIYHLYQP